MRMLDELKRKALLKALEANLGSLVGKSGGDEYRFNCPYCIHKVGSADTKGHLYINLELVIGDARGWSNCYRCGTAAPVKFLIEGCNVDTEVTVSSGSLRKVVLESFLPNTVKSSTRKTAGIIDFPEDFLPVSKETEAYQYLVSRGLSDEDIQEYEIGYGYARLHRLEEKTRQRYVGSGRIIFPDRDLQGRLQYWVARTYKNHKIKYKNCRSDSRMQIYSLSRASQNKDQVVICEGPLSAIRAGRDAVATYGKLITSDQILILAKSNFNRYVVALDGDAKQEAYRLAKALSSKGKKVSIVDFRYGEDPASVDDIRDRIDNAVPFGSKSISLLLRGHA